MGVVLMSHTATHSALTQLAEAGGKVLAQETRPAGGAALDQILIATGGAVALTTVLLVFGYLHRTQRSDLLTRLADGAKRLPALRGLPGWVGLPVVLGTLSLITALLGMYWDISLHITHGRDEGPLANIAHYPILIGLFGVFTSGVLAMVVHPGRAAGMAGSAAGNETGHTLVLVAGRLAGRPGPVDRPGDVAGLGRAARQQAGRSRPVCARAERRASVNLGVLSLPVGEHVLASHPIVTAIPFFVPTFIVAAVIAVVIVRDRRKNGRDQHNDGDS